MHISLPSLSLPPTLPLHPSRSSQSTELSSLCYAAASHWLTVSHKVVCIHQGYFLSPSPMSTQVHSLPLCLSSCPADSFISPIFLDSIQRFVSWSQALMSDQQPVPVGTRVLFGIIVWCGLCVVKGTFRRTRLESCLKWLDKSRGQEKKNVDMNI